MSALLSLAAAAPAADKDLPVLFSFKQPTHNVAVFRGADLKNAIAAGLVKGFGSGSGLGKKIVAAPAVAPIPAPVVVKRPVVAYRPAPVVTYAPKPVPVVTYAPKPAPVVTYAPKPVVTYAPKPVVTYAPKPVAYAPAPKVAYKPYVDQYADEPAYYTYEYAVNDDYSKSAFDANESREQYLTTGKYSVALPGEYSQYSQRRAYLKRGSVGNECHWVYPNCFALFRIKQTHSQSKYSHFRWPYPDRDLHC